MTDRDRKPHRVRVALMVFGILCALSLGALGFRNAMIELSPQLSASLQILVGVSLAGLIVTALTGWTRTRRTLRQQTRELADTAQRLRVARVELDTTRTRHELELRVKTLELEYAVTTRTSRLRIQELEQALERHTGAVQLTEAEPAPVAPATRRGPPVSLNRPRKILREANGEHAASDEEETA
ncbi:MAG: hypothetical protein VYE68_08070 [Acidobacteriota bacterium]|nr:hypothetical protein [Acidobacteriota bacterium]